MDGDNTEVRAEVMRLHYLEGLSIRSIAKRMSIARRTVRQHLGQLPPRREGPRASRQSLLDSFEPKLRSWLEETPELRTPQLLERLRKLGYSGGITILRDRVRKLRPAPTSRAHLTLDFLPAEVMQIDWADFGF